MEVVMAQDVSRDQLTLIRIEGMHCHKCETAIQKALGSNPGVHEVEVDFASGQASVLYDRGAVTVRELMDSVNEAGYHATGFSQQSVDATSQQGTSES
jgi:copper chaperone CopZ